MIDVLFVCYGNICRSPMAEALLDAKLRELLGPDHDVVVQSAGVGAVEGAQATEEARETMTARGLDLSRHRAKRADASIARQAKRIYCMEPSQVTFLQAFAPDSTVELLAGGVEDPIGCGRWVYEAVAAKMEAALDPIVGAILVDRGIGGPGREEPASASPVEERHEPLPVSFAAGEDSVAAGPAASIAGLRVALGSDHAGFRYKELYREWLDKNGYDVIDFGVDTDAVPADYTQISAAVAHAVSSGEAERGVIVAGSGNGEAIVANKIAGIRATVCNDMYTAEMARKHNDANVLCVGQRACGEPVAMRVLEIWMQTEFEGGRHAARIARIAEIERDERTRT